MIEFYQDTLQAQRDTQNQPTRVKKPKTPLSLFNTPDDDVLREGEKDAEEKYPPSNLLEPFRETTGCRRSDFPEIRSPILNDPEGNDLVSGDETPTPDIDNPQKMIHH